MKSPEDEDNMHQIDSEAGGSPSISERVDYQVEIDILIVGIGPAGGALACFLAQNGLSGLIVCSEPSTANTPRAHITNMAALECLRDIGLEEQCVRTGNGGDAMKHTRWCYSMAGDEFARVYSWGADPRRKGDYEMASPCQPLDIPQTLLEPIMMAYATTHGFRIRFNTSFLHFSHRENGRIVSTVHDLVTGVTYAIRSKYLFGADGARSKIQRQLKLPLLTKPMKGTAINVIVKADLTQHVRSRMGNLHFVLQPDRPHPIFGWLCISRMVKPWHEWIFILFPGPGAEVEAENVKNADYLEHIKNLIGDDSIAVEILGISKWNINEIVAEKYSEGNIFCLGDAVHRHPPMNGLGSNTSIQDAYNLAWKVAFVERGIASPRLLESYSTERQPVGLSVVTRANEAFGHQNGVWDALGLTTPTIETRKAAIAELSASTPQGQLRRAAFRRALEGTRAEFHGLGVEMAQKYQSTAVISEARPGECTRPLDAQTRYAQVLEYVPSTLPGCRLPHVWLNTLVPKETQISTHDLAGKAAFCLFTGHGGELWKGAARTVAQELAVPLNAYSIGFGLDWQDVYMDWERVRGVEESGCILVRPDRFVAWRRNEVLESQAACSLELTRVFKEILG